MDKRDDLCTAKDTTTSPEEIHEVVIVSNDPTVMWFCAVHENIDQSDLSYISKKKELCMIFAKLAAIKNPRMRTDSIREVAYTDENPQIYTVAQEILKKRLFRYFLDGGCELKIKQYK